MGLEGFGQRQPTQVWQGIGYLPAMLGYRLQVNQGVALIQTKDIISKQTIGHLAGDIATLLLGLDIDTHAVELLDTEQQRVEIRRADLVARMYQRSNGASFILHLEIQNSDDAAMPLRMMRYYTDIKLEWMAEPILQYLIYIGRNNLTMPDQHEGQDFTYRYRVLDMRTVDCAMLLAKDTPEALVLAILCDFKGKPEQEMAYYIVNRLHELLEHDEKGFWDYQGMLEVLSENRHLQPQVKEAEKMLTQVKVENLPSFQIGLEAGIELGLKQGLEQGLEQGIEQGTLRERLRVAQQLIGLLDEQTIADKTGLSLEEVRGLVVH